MLNRESYPTFGEFMDGSRKQSPTDRILVQAIAVITTQPAYSGMTPEECYAVLVAQAQNVHRQVTR